MIHIPLADGHSNELLEGPFLELRFGPGWTYVSEVRSFLHQFLLKTLQDTATSDRIAMALGELLENAVKYSTSNDAYVRIQMADDGGDVQVEVRNQSNVEMAAELNKVLEKINAMDPLEAYMTMMKESAGHPSRSRLGLARIRYEANGKLNCHFADGRVRMIVQFSS